MKKILLVDDEKEFVEMVTIRLEARGFKVISAFDGDEAVKAVEREKPDLILLDLLMPKVSGFEVCKKLKEDDRFKNIPIIILSGLGQREDIEKTKALGVDSYFIKPLEIEDLVVEINKKVGS
jgi:DNA-binding response OmpR family regulator